MENYWVIVYMEEGKLKYAYPSTTGSWRERMETAEKMAQKVKGYAIFTNKIIDFTSN